MRMTNVMAMRKIMAVKKRNVRPKTTEKMNCKLTLALSWCPSKGNPRLESVLHGGWPPNEGLPTSLEPIDTSPVKGYFKDFPKRLKLELRRYMPNLMGKDKWKNHRAFWRVQWKRHGYPTGLRAAVYFQHLLDLFHRVPNIYALGLTPGKRVRVKDIRKAVEMAFNVKPEVIGSKRTRGISKSFEVDELRFSTDEHQQFVDSLVTYSGHLRCMIESISLPDEPIKKKRAKKKNRPPRERR